MQQPAIRAVDQAVKAAEEKIAFGIFMRAENAAGEKGHDGQ
jgi:hypothetical protein